ncbi:hypothetical protein GGR57DRAFT_154343 [Xylariaceae sp. FL1272]|nr:hypothetical protein GGR57DRAFT_154343 [Xylariaceae sp. FL1272]
MATTPPAADEPSVAISPATESQENDPFQASFSASAAARNHRWSHFDSSNFAHGSYASPAKARRVLEAHLAETDRRMEEAGKVGTALLQQRKVIMEHMDEVDKVEAEGELSEDLRDKLVEIEKDYNEVARESARAFLPKSRVPSNEAAVGSPFVPEGKGGRRSVSPSKFEAQATGSPTKLSVPNRKIRNQPSNRIHDIEFAAEISTSLISQVRNLQGLLAEKEEELRDTRAEQSRLEYEAEGFQQRLKALDDSEHRYKEENWNLETKLQELMAKDKDASDRETKLGQTLKLLQAEKNAAQRELDEIKLSHSKLSEEHAASVKHLDIELGTAKRNMVMGESERAAMQRKIEDLTGQNQELAKAVSASQRGRVLERESIFGMSDEDFQTANDHSTPEHSPPPSPVKGTPRHSMLESETLKTSLAHAQRTIQSLRNNVHREKTERMETKRLLQEARDEIEKLRSDPLAPNRRARKTDSKEFKKPPRLLGGLRSTRSEIFMDDPNWEDQTELAAHPQSSPVSRETTIFEPVAEHTDQFDTANETSDAAFETANEHTDDFHTGAEEFSSDDVETETDSPTKRRTLKGRPPNLTWQRSNSVDSTASTEDEDYSFEDLRTPTSIPPLHTKFPLRVSRGAFRRSRHVSEEPPFQSSPASFANSSNMGTPQQPAQSLAAELGDFDGSDNESNLSATPSRRSVRGRATTPPPAMPPLPKVIMVDSGMMTEPLEQDTPTTTGAIRPISMDTVASGYSVDSNTSDTGVADLDEKLAKFPSPPTSPPKRDFPQPPELAMSTLHSHNVEPIAGPDTHAAEIAALRAEHAEQLKQISTENTAAHSAKLEALKAQHADEAAQAVAALKLAHAQELEALRTKYADATSKAAAEAAASHARHVESLKASHSDVVSRALAEAQATHAGDVETLKSHHAEEASKALADAEAAHARTIETLKASHADEASKTAANIQASHDLELEQLRSSHADQWTRKEFENAAARVAELEALKLAHSEELAKQQSGAKAAFAADLENVKAGHAEEFAKSRADSDAVHAAEVAALVAAHSSQLDSTRKEISDSHSAELDKLKASHADSDAAHAAELAALIAAHTHQLDKTRTELSDSHSTELDKLKASHANQIDQAKKSLDAEHGAELDALKASHQQQIEEAKRSIDVTHAEELESMRTAHSQALYNAAKEKDAFLAAELAALTAMHNKQLDEVKSVLESSHAQEIQSLKTAHAKQQDDLKQEHAEIAKGLVDSHSTQLEEMKRSMSAAHDEQLESHKASHARQQEDLVKEKDAAHAVALAAVATAHSKQLDTHKAENEAITAKEIVALKDSHAQEIKTLNSQHAADQAKALEGFEAALTKQVESSKMAGDSAHAQQIEALNAAHAEIVETHKRDSEKAQAQALEALRSSHERQIEVLNGEHAARNTRELEELAAKHSEEMDTLRAENEAVKAELLRELATTHSKELEELRQELAAKHSQEMANLRSENEALRAELLRELATIHSKELEEVRQELEASHAQGIEAIGAKHAQNLDTLKKEHEAAMSQKLQELAEHHSQQMDGLRKESDQAKSKELAELGASHAEALAVLTAGNDTNLARRLNELRESHARDLEDQRLSIEQSKSREMAALAARHTELVETLKAEHETRMSQKLQEATDHYARDIEKIRKEGESNQVRELSTLSTNHSDDLERLKNEHELARRQELSELKSAHAAALTSLGAEHKSALEQALQTLKTEHAQALESLQSERDLDQSKVLSALDIEHSNKLEQLKHESDATLARELDRLAAQHQNDLEARAQDSDAALSRELESIKAQHARELDHLAAQHENDPKARARDNDAALGRELESIKAQHARDMNSHMQQSSAERERLIADHAAELEALKKSLTVDRPALSYSPLSSVQTEPVESKELKSPRREAFIIPQDRQPSTPLGGKKTRNTGTPVIAEDDTRQSPSAVGVSDTPESQRPFKEITANAEARPSRKLQTETSHQSSQTTLTGESLDRLVKNQRRQSQDSVTITTDRGRVVITPFDDAATGSPSTVRIRRSSVDSQGSIARARHRIPDSSIVAAPEPIPPRRPGSSASTRTATRERPPLPANHREAIEAARSGSAHGRSGSMGPPLVPASAYRNPNSRPETPSARPPPSPITAKGTPTPRAGRTTGIADVQSPTRMPMRSRQSSISSFASEIDSRFNIRDGMSLEAAGFGPSTDPRMIQAITQTMIGEYLWKYTRKAGRGEMSENRHRRYFWVHPYTRTLYWSDRDPSTGGRSELKAKSVPIEAVRVVADDNIMPPGLHRKSLIVISPGRTVKFTCTTGQRHETWFNALSYLLLRTGNEDQVSSEQVAGNLTQEDVDEFNPSINRAPTNGNRPPVPPSLSSYNSRTTRNESPAMDISSMAIPTLTPTHERGVSRTGSTSTLGKLSGYWKASKFGSMRSTRGHAPYTEAIYEANEVQDSAEDLRQMLEQHDRDSNRLENVRACCDGKHDVGTLPHVSKRGRLSGRHSHTQTHPHTHPASHSMGSVRSTRA